MEKKKSLHDILRSVLSFYILAKVVEIITTFVSFRIIDIIIIPITIIVIILNFIERKKVKING